MDQENHLKQEGMLYRYNKTFFVNIFVAATKPKSYPDGFNRVILYL